ncbi:MAG TPA: hypothetical protein VIK89_13520 [Cytophagaceae bacterium]
MKRIMFFPALLITAGVAMSQPKATSLNEKWNTVLQDAETYQHYKVIKISELNQMWKTVQDSVSALKTQIKNENAEIKEQQAQIKALQEEVASLKDQLTSVSIEKDNMKFLGMEVDKYSYATSLWAFIFITLAGCGVLFYLFKNSHKVTKQKIMEYEHLFNRFEDYKKNKIETERKLKRELQTNINLIEELKLRQTRA